MERDHQIDDEQDYGTGADFDLGEPSLANLLAAIDAAPDLPVARKTHWSTSTRSLCRCLEMSPDSLPARLSGLSIVDKIVAAVHGISDKTLTITRATEGGADVVPQGRGGVSRGAPLSPEWKAALGL